MVLFVAVYVNNVNSRTAVFSFCLVAMIDENQTLFGKAAFTPHSIYYHESVYIIEAERFKPNTLKTNKKKTLL